MNLAALPLSTVLGQFSYVQCHVHVMNISDPHIHHSRLHGSDQGLGLLMTQTDTDIQPLTPEARDSEGISKLALLITGAYKVWANIIQSVVLADN